MIFTPTQYVKNYAAYDQWRADLRQHQTKASEAMSNHTNGQVLSPCGTGKSRIQTDVLVGGMIAAEKNNEQKCFAIASHRLALNTQLLETVLEVAVKCSIHFNMIFIGSDTRMSKRKFYKDKLGFNERTCEYLQTLSGSEVKSFIEKSHDQGRQVLIVTTYHSINRLEGIDIEICTYDEAHNTVQRDFTANILKVKENIKRNYFFTATRKGNEDDFSGMANEEFYGTIIFDASPGEMQDRGEIAKPSVQFLCAEKNGKKYDPNSFSNKNVSMLVATIFNGFNYHESLIKKHSCNPDLIGPKLIIGFNSIKEMHEVTNDVDFKLKTIDIKVFTISSNNGGEYMLNGQNISRDDWFEELNNLADSESAIIGNVDMLTEGIDLPSITGVLPLRNLGKVKLIQMIGRALRLHPEDRKNIYNNTILPEETNKFIKPYGYLLLPAFLTSTNEYERMFKNAAIIYNEYNSPIAEFIVKEQYSEFKNNDAPSVLEDEYTSGAIADVKSLEVKIKIDLTKDVLMKMTREQRMAAYNKLFESSFT